MKPGPHCHRGGRTCSGYTYLSILSFLLALSLLLGAGGVFAAQTNESRGPGGYGWQQVFSNSGGGATDYARLTGSADRMNYDWGYKKIQIYTREEDYWAQDCGWWYVGGGNTTGIKIVDAAGDTVAAGSNFAPTKGRYIYTYTWGADDDPGRWTVYVNDTMNNLASFYIYVRGQLNVSVATTGNTAGSAVTIDATVTDNAGNPVPGNYVDNAGNSAAPSVTAYVAGAGESFVVPLSDANNDGVWTGTFTPQNPGDHKITVKASDGHKYWVDGRGSKIVSIAGSFPASLGLTALLRTFGAIADTGLSSLAAAVAAVFGALIGRRWYRV